MKYNFGLDLECRNSLSLLIERIKPNTTILEFGPAHGRMTKYLKEELNCKVYAVEMDQEAAQNAAEYTEKIVVDNIEAFGWKREFETLQFDYIIFADVLEHLYSPKEVLESVRSFLKDDGSILVSIPNIAHNAIILNLFKNEFNYHPTGLLDDTHIRFFTQKTFDALIEKSRYFKSYETAVYMRPSDTEFKVDYDELPVYIGEYLKTLPWGERYQLIYELRKSEVEVCSDFLEEYRNYSRLYVQLFVDTGDGFSEEQSIKFAVEQNSEKHTFIFDLSNYENIVNLRLDPLNECCAVILEDIALIDHDGSTKDMADMVLGNTNLQEGQRYFFDTDDSQLYFHSMIVEALKNAGKLRVTLKFTHFGKEALQICLLEQRRKLIELDESLRGFEAELNGIYNSRSWKLAQTMRYFYSMFFKNKE